MGTAGRITNALCEFFETGNDGLAIERQVCLRPKNSRKVLGQHAPQQNVGVGQRKWARTAIAGWARIGTRRIRADAKTRAIEMQNRPATCGDRVNAQHGGAQPDAGHLGFKFTLKFTGIMRDIGRCTPHIETNRTLKPSPFTDPSHSHDTAGRAG